MLDDRRQRHRERPGQLADRVLATPKPDEHGTPGGVGESTEDGVEPIRCIVNHKVKCERDFRACQARTRDLRARFAARPRWRSAPSVAEGSLLAVERRRALPSGEDRPEREVRPPDQI